MVPVMPVSALSRTLQGPTGKERHAHLHFNFPLQVNNITPPTARQMTHTGQTRRYARLRGSNTVRNCEKYQDKAGSLTCGWRGPGWATGSDAAPPPGRPAAAAAATWQRRRQPHRPQHRHHQHGTTAMHDSSPSSTATFPPSPFLSPWVTRALISRPARWHTHPCPCRAPPCKVCLATHTTHRRFSSSEFPG